MSSTILVLAAIGFATIVAAVTVAAVWLIHRICSALAKDAEIDPMNYIVGATTVIAAAIVICFAVLGVFEGSDRIHLALYGRLPS